MTHLQVDIVIILYLSTYICGCQINRLTYLYMSLSASNLYWQVDTLTYLSILQLSTSKCDWHVNRLTYVSMLHLWTYICGWQVNRLTYLYILLLSISNYYWQVDRLTYCSILHMSTYICGWQVDILICLSLLKWQYLAVIHRSTVWHIYPFYTCQYDIVSSSMMICVYMSTCRTVTIL